MSSTSNAHGRFAPRDDGGADEFTRTVYAELHRLAKAILCGDKNEHSLPATALVHEAYIKLVQSASLRCESKAHFVAVAARAMRQIVVDHARSRRSARRGGARHRVTLERVLDLADTNQLDLVALDDSLRHLESIDPMLSRIVELRFFGGLSLDETATFLAISTPTVKRHWQLAKGWLYQEISGGRAPQP